MIRPEPVKGNPGERGGRSTPTSRGPIASRCLGRTPRGQQLVVGGESEEVGGARFELATSTV